MGEVAGGRAGQIVAVALELLEEHGPDGVTMRAIADRVGIRAPTLYKHVPDKDAVEIEMIAEGFRQMADGFTAAVRDADDPLWALATAYRTWARASPHLYRLMTHKALDRERLPEGVEDAAAAPVVELAGGDPDRARALWAFAHGMTSLELAGRFPPDADLDAAWRSGLEALRPSAGPDQVDRLAPRRA